MKYIIRFYPFLLLILSGCAVSTHVPAQSSPTLVTGSSSSVIPYDAYRYAKYQFKIPRGCDTTNALRGGKDSLGLMYYDSCHNILYVRSVVPTNHNQHTWGSASSATGSVQSVSVGNFTNFASSSVFDPTGNPSITFSLTQAGAHKYFGNNTGSLAAPNYYQPATTDLSDFPSQTSNNGKFLTTNGSALSWAVVSGTGTVTSAALTMPTGFSVGGSPITTNGTFAITTTLNGLIYGNGSNSLIAANITAPLSFSGGTLSMPVATDGQSGYLSASDHAAFNAKQSLITGAATTVVSSNLTSNKVAISNSSGKIDVATQTTTDLTNWALAHTQQSLTDGATITMNCTNGYLGSVTLAGNRTLSITNITSGYDVMIIVTQDATGNRTLTLPANSIVPIGFGTGTTINLSTAGGAKDIIYDHYNGTNHYWTIAKNFQ